VNWIRAIPLAWRLGLVSLAGACLGSLANWAIAALAFEPRSVSPWAAQPGTPRRRWFDRVPILGWLRVRGETPVHGSGFWIRPLVIEVLFAAGAAALYWWEIDRGGLLPEKNLPMQPLLRPLVDIHAQWLCHVMLFWLMLVTSVIDADEKLIPDAITVPGTILGLTTATICPFALLPVLWNEGGMVRAGFLHLSSPGPWPAGLAGWPHVGSLALALACWWLWCVALVHRTWYDRHGWRRALGLMLARIARERSTWRLVWLGLAGSVGILAVWLWGVFSWMGLLTALVGMAAGGGLIWAVRIIGYAVLRREAMGFGDVTLMAMIGAFLGWQSCPVIFFLAPLAGLVIGLIQLVFGGDSEIPYGPFLCLAAAVVIIDWEALWQGWQGMEKVLAFWGVTVPLLMVFCLAAMAVLLALWRAVRGVFIALWRAVRAFSGE
jgi:prepilin signal peptidase PulO-like enzyme (type II secretory pathway)